MSGCEQTKIDKERSDPGLNIRTSPMSAADLELDIAEAKSLLEQATRPAVTSALRALLRTSEVALAAEKKKLDEAAAAAAAAEQKKEANQKKLAELEEKKKAAVEAEDFELCAKLRDEIAALTKAIEDPSSSDPAPPEATVTGAGGGAAAAPAPAFRPAVNTKWVPLDKFAWVRA